MSYASLKPWEQAFVDHYVSNVHAPNGTKAVRAARPGLKRPDVMASKLLSRTDVRLAIEERMRRRRERIELDEKWVLERLRSIVERCMQAEPVLDRKGDPTGEYRFDSAGANRALELIGKHFAMFTDRIQAEVETSDVTDEPLSDEQWERQYATH
jgi:phage terminase small subunit